MIANMPHIHSTVPYTGTAAIAAFLIDPYAYQAEAIKKTVNCPKRTEKTTEAAVAENTCETNHQHDNKFPCKD